MIVVLLLTAFAFPAALSAAPDGTAQSLDAGPDARSPSIDGDQDVLPKCPSGKCLEPQYVSVPGGEPTRDDGGLSTLLDASSALPRPRGGDRLQRGGSHFFEPSATLPAAAGPLTASPHAAVVALLNARGLACTGSLVGPRAVLTARHCLPLTEARFGPDARNPLAIQRIVTTRTPSEFLDVALVELAAAVAIEPLRLREVADADAPSGSFRLIGYGALDSAGVVASSARHYADVQVRDWGCDEASAGRLACRPGFELVIPRGAGADTCVGDSGGPVLERTGSGFRILAVTSRAVGEALLRCGDGGVYTRADRIAQWVSANLRLMEKKK